MATFDEINEKRGDWHNVTFQGPQGTTHTQRMMPRHQAGSVSRVAPGYVDPRFASENPNADPNEEAYRFTSADDGMEYFLPPSAVTKITPVSSVAKKGPGQDWRKLAARSGQPLPDA